MYSSIIEIKKNIAYEKLMGLRSIAEKAFSNRAGSVKNSSKELHRLVFKGDESEFGCLEVGMLELKRVEGFLSQVDSWKWIDDEDPEENCDILKVLAMSVR